MTSLRMCHLLQFQPDKQRDVLDFVRHVNQRPIKLEEAKQAKEVFMVGSATVVRALFRPQLPGLHAEENTVQDVHEDKGWIE